MGSKPFILGFCINWVHLIPINPKMLPNKGENKGFQSLVKVTSNTFTLSMFLRVNELKIKLPHFITDFPLKEIMEEKLKIMAHFVPYQPLVMDVLTPAQYI